MRKGWVVFCAALACISTAACNSKEKEEAARRQAEIDSMTYLREHGGTDLSNPEMGSKIILRLTEYKIEMVGDTTIPKGQVTFAIENHGKAPHQIEVKGPSGTWQTSVMPAGSNILLSMVLDKPGPHDIYSTAGSDKGKDRDLGMATRVMVKYQ